MGLPVTAPEHVANLLNRWYIEIQQNQLEESGLTKKEIEGLLDGMEEDQTVLLYYSLLDYRYQCLVKEKERSEKSSSNDLDALMAYYFYFYKGMHAYKIRAFEEAVECYHEAEKRLDHVTDEIEKAEFYYKVGSLYYHIYRTELSLDFAKKALAIFEKDPHYTIRTAHSRMVIALNLMSLKEFSSAKDYLNKAWEIAVHEKDESLKFGVCHNLGVLYREAVDPEATIRWMLESTKYKQPDHRTLYMLAEGAGLLNQQERAEKWIKEGMEFCQKIGHKEYWHRFRILKVKSGDYHPKLVEKVMCEALDYFKHENLWGNIVETVPYLIKHYEKLGKNADLHEAELLLSLANEKLAEEI